MEEVSCVAKWKEGSTFYFLGLINNSHVQPDDYERRFRCFAYSKFFQGYHVAQSGDAECNLPNSKEGDRTMVLKQGEIFHVIFILNCGYIDNMKKITPTK